MDKLEPTAAKDAAVNETEKKGPKPPANRRGESEKKIRPKRNRKRPRSQVHSNDNLNINTTIQRLEMGGKPILDGVSEHFIRVIHPYPYTFSSFAKQRWVGRTVLDVYVSEFGSYPESYYRAAIRQGRILVSDNKVDLSYKIQGKDILTHIVHRHEPGVAVCHPAVGSNQSETNANAGKEATNLVKIIDETNDLVIIDKPGTLPMHPCGGYHLNSLTSILEGEATTADGQSKKKYFNIHRLDRLTSGLVILAKSTEVAKQWSQSIRQRDCQKYYLARVRGKFPVNVQKLGIKRIQAEADNETPQDGEWPSQKAGESSTPIESARRKHAHGYWITESCGSVSRHDVSLSVIANSSTPVDDWLKRLEADGSATKGSAAASTHWLHLACPTRISKPKNGVCEAGAFHDLADDAYLKTVKPAQTSFGVVSYDATSDSTLLLCRPITGRTHQIRLHCEYLGHPIANDPNYGGDIWYGNDQGKEACSKARRLLRNDAVDNGDGAGENEVLDKSTADVPASEEEINQLSGIVQEDGEPVEKFINRTCVWCARMAGRDVAEHSMLEFLLRSRGIWLHALQYCIGVGQTSNVGEGDNKICRYRTELPSWARPYR